MFKNVSHPHSSLQSHIFVLKKNPAYYNYTNICNILIFYVYASLKIKFKKVYMYRYSKSAITMFLLYNM